VWFDPTGKEVVRKSGAKGKIAVDHRYAAEISIDGQRVATAPYAGEIELVAGEHRITIEEPGCAPRHLDIEVQKSDVALPINTIGPCLPPGTAAAPPPPPPAAIVYVEETNTGAWIATGVGAALAAAGGVFIGTYVEAASRRNGLIDEEPDRFDARPVRRADNQAFAYSIASGSSFGAAAIAFTTAIILFLTTTGEAAPDYNFGPTGGAAPPDRPSEAQAIRF
jgi:hypothetical protein